MGKEIMMAVFTILFLSYGAYGTVATQEEGAPIPVITQSFASAKIRPGETWRVYLNAHHAHGEMKNILVIVEQPGVGQYPMSTIRVEERNRKDLSGYLYLGTSTSINPLNFINLRLTIYIQDFSGIFSQPVVFPLELNSRFSQDLPPEGVFKDEELGPIMIKLKTRGGKGGGGS